MLAFSSTFTKKYFLSLIWSYILMILGLMTFAYKHLKANHDYDILIKQFIPEFFSLYLADVCPEQSIDL